MMGLKEDQKELFSYSVDLDRRVRPENPLRQISETIDFTFVRQEVKEFYGYRRPSGSGLASVLPKSSLTEQ